MDVLVKEIQSFFNKTQTYPYTRNKIRLSRNIVGKNAIMKRAVVFFFFQGSLSKSLGTQNSISSPNYFKPRKRKVMCEY